MHARAESTMLVGGRLSLGAAFDPFSPEANASPTDWDAHVRESGAFVWLEKYGAWATGRHDEVKAVLDDWSAFTSVTRPFFDPNFPVSETLITQDPPGHTVTRAAISKIMSGPAIRKFTSLYESEARRIVTAMLAAERGDAFSDLALPYILKVFGDVVGLPDEGRDNLVHFGAAILATLGPTNELYRQLVEEAQGAMAWVHSHSDPSALTAGSFGGELHAAAQRGEISHELAHSLVLAMLSAGVDTTVASIVNVVQAFATHPGQWKKLRSNPKLVNKAFEEALRYNPPARIITRTASEDVSIGGAYLKKGDGILLFFGAACRDPRKWPNPDEFDIDRNTSGHLAFGAGIHNCVGQTLTRVEVLALLTEMAGQIDMMTIEGEVEPLASNLLQSYSKLPVRFI